MKGTRLRLVEVVEWLVAAGCVLALVAIGAILSRDVPGVRPVIPVLAGAPTAPAVPSNIWPGAISVPELLLPDGQRFGVGEPASRLTVLDVQAQSGPTIVERSPQGVRESRIYRFASMDFAIVVAGDRIVAIYR
jgi:hypothetical protein